MSSKQEKAENDDFIAGGIVMHKKLFIPGPVDVRPEVLAKMSTPMISHRGKAATELG